MSITLAMAQPIEAQLAKRVEELRRKVYEVSEVEWCRGETVMYPEQTVEAVVEELVQTEHDLITLRVLRDAANINTEVRWSLVEDKPLMNITEAIATAKGMRRLLGIYEELAGKNPNITSSSGRFSSSDNLRKLTFDPRIYSDAVETMKRQVNALSLAIDQANQTVTLDFDASKYLEGLKF